MDRVMNWLPRQQQEDSLFVSGAPSTDRKNQLTGFGGLGSAESLGLNEGGSATGKADDYYSSLLSGDPNATAAAVAPVSNALGDQAATLKSTISNDGTSRGGGVNSQILGIGDQADKGIIDAITGIAPGAAAHEASIGQGLLGLGTQASGTLAGQAGSAREFDTSEADKRAAAEGSILGGNSVVKAGLGIFGF